MDSRQSVFRGEKASKGEREEFPDSGSATPDDWLNEQGYRMAVCKKRIAIYRVIHETVYVWILKDCRNRLTVLRRN